MEPAEITSVKGAQRLRRSGLRQDKYSHTSLLSLLRPMFHLHCLGVDSPHTSFFNLLFVEMLWANSRHLFMRFSVAPSSSDSHLPQICFSMKSWFIFFLLRICLMFTTQDSAKVLLCSPWEAGGIIGHDLRLILHTLC